MPPSDRFSQINRWHFHLLQDTAQQQYTTHYFSPITPSTLSPSSALAAKMPEPVASTSASSAYNDEPDMSIFENKTGLAEDMKFLASMPELCDVTFLVGETREPVCAVKVMICRPDSQFVRKLC